MVSFYFPVSLAGILLGRVLGRSVSKTRDRCGGRLEIPTNTPSIRARNTRLMKTFCRGRLVQDLKSSKRPKLNCRNWECGVVIPVYAATDKPGLAVEGAGEEVSNRESLDVFASTVPIPMKVPGELYETSSTNQPWCSED